MTENPTLSVIVATTHPWPEVEACLERLLAQTMAIGGEVILGDGDGGEFPVRCPASFGS